MRSPRCGGIRRSRTCLFVEGRTKVGATAIVRNHRGKEMQRLPMTCTNPGLDRWEAMLTCGEHSDVKPWQPEFAAIKRQLGEWSVTIEGWEDTYKSWLHDFEFCSRRSRSFK